MSTVTLVGVIGPVEPELLTAWCRHYQEAGIERFAVALHRVDVDKAAQDELATAMRETTGCAPELTVTGPWHECVHGDLRDQLRARAGDGWHVIADSDEFQQHVDGIGASLRAAEAGGQGVLGGLLLDRVAADGSLPAWRADVGLDRSYPLGGLLTHLVTRGEARKIVLAHSSVGLSPGNHRAPGRRPPSGTVVPVHHFKWRAGVESDLRRRIENFGTRWVEFDPAVRTEAERLLTYVALNNGRIDVTHGPVLFRPVSLRDVPPWWDAEARALVREVEAVRGL
ncbi:hypothetical protein [Streptoalloteichus hindustanus]|uniref:Uncharacterized protein n=1 Tax=Streptoalloteichus hindustanus TaxID=2017 RepID=A0A1M5IHL1_STRHI|nr:hypothetical protein [Streptoalloteichus hindustanus]SHG27283.1 hypothetical protein SAMN05444320_107270 [Streptoalloteichus hindustanus]